MTSFPKTVDGRSIALYAAENGGVGVSILGQPAFVLDRSNAIAFAKYLVSMTFHSLTKEE